MSDDYDEADIGMLIGMDILPRVIRNSAICLLCGEEVESEYTHHFNTCRCGNLSVDGGHEYTRRVFREHGTWRETSVFGRSRPEDGMKTEDRR